MVAVLGKFELSYFVWFLLVLKNNVFEASDLHLNIDNCVIF